MSIAISARPGVYTPLFQAKPAPEAIPHPKNAEPAAGTSPSGASSSFATTAGDAASGATVAADAAQQSQGAAQESAHDPQHEPGLQDDQSMLGDINGDDRLDSADVMALMKAFNTSTEQADLNADGTVDTADLGMLIGAIRDYNARVRPDNTPGDGPDRNLYPMSSALFGSGEGAQTEVKASSVEPGDPISETIGGSGEPESQPGVFGDLTGDGVINGDDYGVLRKSFGSSEGVGDLNGDGLVDTADLGTMLGLMREAREA